jgi:hypothetical protein
MAPQGQPTIEPGSVTKPLQLLAAWLVGLILVNGSFLTAAGIINEPPWIPAVLVGAAILNVPIFLVCLFYLQTRFRPEMQEDAYYSRYLERKYSNQTNKTEVVEVSAETLRSFDDVKNIPTLSTKKQISPRHSGKDVHKTGVMINDLSPRYKDIVDRLTASGFTIERTFGSTSDKPRTPNPFVIAFGDGVSVKVAQELIGILKEFDVEGVAYAPDDFNELQIYIGAYSYEERHNFVRLDTPTGKRLLDSSTDSEEFYRIISNAWIKPPSA